MVKNLTRVDIEGAQPRAFDETDLQNVTVVNTEFRDVAWVQADKTSWYGTGFGPRSREINTDGWSDLDVKATGNGALAAGADIGGVLRYILYRDSRRSDPVAVSGEYKLSALRAAETASLRDKILVPGMLSDIVTDDGYLALQIEADAASDGAEVADEAQSTSEQGMAYSEVASNIFG